MGIAEAVASGMTTKQIIEEVLASDGVHFLVKDTLREALTHDPVDALRDIRLVADILKARWEEMGAPKKQI